MKNWKMPLRVIVYVLILAACLFVAAGRADLPWFWAYLAVFSSIAIAGTLLVDPEVLAERHRPGGRKPPLGLNLLILPAIAQHIVAGLDVGRYQWTNGLPAWVQAVALTLTAAGWGVSFWAMRVNRFFSSVVRIQTERGHHVVTGGPYRWVRHPGYASGLVYVITTGVALGSLPSILPNLAVVPFLLYRAVTEDRLLKSELPGYEEYAAHVRYRFFPGVW